ncbi:MAG: metallophosphoesterase [Lactobacillales bacterium]|jgi:predicted MPP superfamily phosphohydrolase|nr:metallophosphoesterase [Lactobacillales bacterium]
MSFITIILTMGLIFTSLIFVRTFAGMPVHLFYKIVGFFIILSAFVAPFTIRRTTFSSTGLYTIVSDTLYFIFLYALLFGVLMVLRDVIWVIAYRIYTASGRIAAGWSPLDYGVVMKANLFLAVILVFVCFYALYEGKRVPRVEKLEITSSKIKEKTTMVVLADLHLHRTLSVNKLKGIVDKVNKLNPDIIVLPGDTIDDWRKNIQEHVSVLKGLKAKKGIYATPGNHEFYIGLEASEKMIKDIGAVYLADEGTMVQKDIFIAGILDYNTHVKRAKGQFNLEKALKGSKGKYTVLLSHTPLSPAIIKEDKIDLQISGHTHGGQVFPAHIITKYVNGYLSGLYETGEYLLYVSKGSGQWGPPLRLLAPSEITFITLNPEK